MFTMEKREEDMKTEVKGLKDTLSGEHEKLKTLYAKYDNTQECLKGCQIRPCKGQG